MVPVQAIIERNMLYYHMYNNVQINSFIHVQCLSVFLYETVLVEW